jgi:hypothetical protein
LEYGSDINTIYQRILEIAAGVVEICIQKEMAL